jgi:Holliday junction resolvase-like predicted endonuclease
MGIARRLTQGKLQLNTILNRIEIEYKEGIFIPYLDIAPADWGQVYEKYVGQVLEEEGYQVTYRGLELGFMDQGIDLIAEKENSVLFIQCKYKSQKISKSHIEWILQKASKLLLEKHTKYDQKITFLLVVNNLNDNFSKRIPKNFNFDLVSSKKVVYPLLEYFLSHNHTQDKVKLDVREIEMVI